MVCLVIDADVDGDDNDDDDVIMISVYDGSILFSEWMYKLKSSSGTAFFCTSCGTVGFLLKMEVTTIELAITLLYDCSSLCLERTYVYCKCSNR